MSTPRKAPDFSWNALAANLADGPAAAAKAVGSEVHVMDSHTEGEPTRLVLGGAPELGPGPATDRVARMRADHDDFRSRLVNEPRGNPATVGVVMGRPVHPEALLQAIYFNNVGYLTMCVHATIGLVHTLARVAGLPRGAHRIETPAGLVQATLELDGSVSVENVASRRVADGVAIETRDHGTVLGDVAYGGNWFFITRDPADHIGPDDLPRLHALARDVSDGLKRSDVRGDGGVEVDHVYVTGTPSSSDLDQRNFVLCPGGAHDRSPCGTGTSANVACLAADGRLDEGQVWRQESCIGTRFTARFRRGPDDSVVPTVNGRAYLTAAATVIVEPDDPFGAGIP